MTIRPLERAPVGAEVQHVSAEPGGVELAGCLDSGLVFAQGDGSRPSTPLASTALGEHGIGVMGCRFEKGIYARGDSLHHMVFFTLQSAGKVACRIADLRLEHEAPRGNLTLCPAGARCSADSPGRYDAFVMFVPKEPLAFASAERSRPNASLVERVDGADARLLGLAQQLARQVRNGFEDGPLAWHDLSSAVMDRLVDVHLSEVPQSGRGRLDRSALTRVLDCIHARAEGHLSVEELSDAAQQSRSHFPRLFRRSTGLSPYQYVVRVRLERALSLLRTTSMSIAEVAAQMGFSDQSHMCRWFRRVYGASPKQMIIRVG